jgi:hypothetical protein
VLPPIRVAAIVFVTEAPALTETLPEFETVKLKFVGAPAFENQTLASALGCKPLLKAFAFISVLVESVKGRLYFCEDCVGDCPSVV